MHVKSPFSSKMEDVVFVIRDIGDYLNNEKSDTLYRACDYIGELEAKVEELTSYEEEADYLKEQIDEKDDEINTLKERVFLLEKEYLGRPNK